MPSVLPGPQPPPIVACVLLAMSPTPRSRAAPVCLDTRVRQGCRRPSARRGPLLLRMLLPASNVLQIRMHRPTDLLRAQTVLSTAPPRVWAPHPSSSATAMLVTTATTSTPVSSVLLVINAPEMSAHHALQETMPPASRHRAPPAAQEASRRQRGVLCAQHAQPVLPSFILWSART